MTPFAWSALSFFLGLILGHWLALGRDKRKELNDAVAPVRAWVARQLMNPDSDLWPPPGVAELDAMHQRLSKSDSARFSAAWTSVLLAYAKARSVDSWGAAVFAPTDEGLEALRVLAQITRAR